MPKRNIGPVCSDCRQPLVQEHFNSTHDAFFCNNVKCSTKYRVPQGNIPVAIHARYEEERLERMEKLSKGKVINVDLSRQQPFGDAQDG